MCSVWDTASAQLLGARVQQNCHVEPCTAPAAPQRICEHSISDPACLGGQKQHLKEQPSTVAADYNFIIRRTGMTQICTLKYCFQGCHGQSRAWDPADTSWSPCAPLSDFSEGRNRIRTRTGERPQQQQLLPCRTAGSTRADSVTHVLLRINKSIFKPAVVLWRAKNQILSFLYLLKQTNKKKKLNEKTFQHCYKLRYKVITLIQGLHLLTLVSLPSEFPQLRSCTSAHGSADGSNKPHSSAATFNPSAPLQPCWQTP